MLEVGNGELTADENNTHFSLWCILSAPLMMGNDIRNATPEILEILLNREAIAINQDPLGRQGVKVRDDGDLEVWSKVLHDGSRAVVLFNRSEKKANIGVRWTEIGYPAHLNAKVRDIWRTADLGTFGGGFEVEVASHAVVMCTIRP